MTASAFVAYVSYSAGLNPGWGMVSGTVASDATLPCGDLVRRG